MPLLTVTKIISGGQVGADRAGLDFAIKHSIPHGGWCPKYRIAQDGLVPMKYQLQEAEKHGYWHRTKLNVRDSDATVVFTPPTPGRGSSMTIQSCLDFGRPYLHITTEQSLDEAAARLLKFITERKVKTLNVAGSRKPDLYQFTLLVLQLALSPSQPKIPPTCPTPITAPIRNIHVPVNKSTRRRGWSLYPKPAKTLMDN